MQNKKFIEVQDSLNSLIPLQRVYATMVRDLKVIQKMIKLELNLMN